MFIILDNISISLNLHNQWYPLILKGSWIENYCKHIFTNRLLVLTPIACSSLNQYLNPVSNLVTTLTIGISCFSIQSKMLDSIILVNIIPKYNTIINIWYIWILLFIKVLRKCISQPNSNIRRLTETHSAVCFHKTI